MENDTTKIVRRALDEDIHTGDITTESTVPSNSIGHAVIIVKQDAVIAGMNVAETVFKLLDEEITFISSVVDGDHVSSGQTIIEITGKLSTILKGERTALNFLGHLSGIATLAAAYVQKIEATKAKILDTRKTTPNLRKLEKYAVQQGGGVNHRMGLYDDILIKENHIRAAGGIIPAVEKAKDYLFRRSLACEIVVEVQTLVELQQVLKVKVNRVLLDNMPLSMLKEAVKMVQGKIPLEASGGVNLESVRGIAETGVDFISVGALTHSAKNVDLSLLIKE